MSRSLAAWADHWLLPIVVWLLLLADLGTGLNWALSPAAALGGPAYDIGKLCAPMRVYGLLFLVLTVACAGLLLGRGRAWLTGYSLMFPAALWGFWSVLFGWAAHSPRVSYQGVVFSLLLFSLHAVAGLALSRDPRKV